MSAEIPFVYEIPKHAKYDLTLSCECGKTMKAPVVVYSEEYVSALERKIKMLAKQDTIHKQIHEKHSEREKQFLIMKQALMKIAIEDPVVYDGFLALGFKEIAQDTLKRLNE